MVQVYTATHLDRVGILYWDEPLKWSSQIFRTFMGSVRLMPFLSYT